MRPQPPGHFIHCQDQLFATLHAFPAWLIFVYKDKKK